MIIVNNRNTDTEGMAVPVDLHEFLPFLFGDDMTIRTHVILILASIILDNFSKINFN